MNRKILCFAFYFVLALAGRSYAQVVINEVQSSNFSSLQNETGDYEDWIELYNAGSTYVNLGGYGLSDNSGNLFKFTFPPYLLPANKHVLIFADDTNQVNVGAHWETAIKADDTWKYLANLVAPPDTNWRNLSFNDAGWNSGKGGIGYGDNDDSTIVPMCISVYMRKTFSIPDTSKIVDAIFNIDFDDGMVAYLNGVEIARVNTGSIGIRPLWNMAAYANYEAKMYQGMDIDSFHVDKEFLHSIIKNGTNVLAIEVHNLNNTSSDLSCIPFLSFKMKDAATSFGPVPSWFQNPAGMADYFHADFKISKTGETIYLTNSAGTIVDQIALPALEMDHSYGRNTDGENLWKYFEATTPDTTNNISSGRTGYATIPLFSLQGGFYTGTQTLTLSTSFPGGIIRYTTNGNTPNDSSTLYTSPITLSATASIRARVFSTGSMPSQTVTNTYLINLDCRMTVYSLVLDSADLWDYNEGIFVLGPNASTVPPYYGANYWADWEKYMSLEFFDKQKNRAFKFNAGLSITGGWSRRANQKSLEVSLRDKYGLSKINYNLIPDKSQIGKWDDFLLHTTGNDRGYAHMRDPVMERLMKGTHSDYTAYEPCLLYINGGNWGVYYTKENDDANFVKNNYGYDKDEIDFLKERSAEYPDIIVREGDEVAFKYLHNYAMTNAPADPGFYNAIDSMIEIKNQVDYFAAETYYPNDDWMGGSNNNLKMWRPREIGGRFRYILYDLDFGFGMYGTVDFDMLATAMNPSPHNFNSDIFQRLLQNPKYKNYFINRYADLINTNWLPSNVANVVAGFRDSMRYDMHFQYEKWAGGDTNTWKANIDNVLNFSAARPAHVRNQIQNNLGMTGQVTITLQASPPEAGRIQISTITPSALPWSGVYFNGNPVRVTAIPNPGFTFDHWHSNVAFPVNDTNKSAERNYTANDVVTAYFTGSPVTPLITFSEVNYNADSASNSGDWVELHNMTPVSLDLSGWKLRDAEEHHEFVFPVSTVIAPNGYLVVAEDLVKFQSQHPSVTNVIGETGFNFSDGGDQIRLFRYNDSLLLSMEYSDQLPWPATADGDGYTLELLDSSGDLNDGNNWFAGCPGGSPGGAYVATVAEFSASGPTSICQGDTVVLTASVANGNLYQWQRNHVSVSGATGFSYQPAVGGTYTVSVSNDGCTAVSDSVVVVINSVSTNPVITSVSRCGTGSVTLNAIAIDSISWFDLQYNLVGSGTSFTTPSLTQTAIYFARAGTVCPSEMIADTITINPVPSTPVVTGQSICGPGTLTLTATSDAPIKWYDAPNGNLVFTGSSFITPVLNQTTTYYAQSGIVCKSNFIPVVATVNPVSAAPVSGSVSFCGEAVVTLSAIAADSITWYDSQNNPVGSGLTFTTPLISQTTIYYVRAGSICPSTLIADTITINPVPSTPVVTGQSICGPGVLTLTATSDAPIKWYDAQNGNLIFSGSSFITPVLNQTTTYYAQSGIVCKSNFIPVVATVNPVSAAPVTSSVSRCDEGVITLYASSPDTIRWYDNPNGNLINSGTIFQTPFLNSTATYYLSAGTVCPSNLVPVQAIISAVTPDPVVTGVSRCGAGSVTFIANATDTVRWFDSPNGNLLFTGNSFTTPSLSINTVYFVTSGIECVSNEVAVQATINTVSADPVVTGSSVCGTASLTLFAQSIDPVNWFDSPNGNLLFTGSNFTTPSIAQTTTYFARANSICPSGFVPVTATVIALPPDPVASGDSRCGPGVIDLSATGTDTIRWYDSPNGNLLAAGSIFITPALNQSATYYVRAEGACAGNFIPVQAIINPVPLDAVAADQSRCGSGSISLNATSGDTIRWYDFPNGNLLATGSIFITPALNQSATYYVRAEGACAGNYIPVHAIINPVPLDAVAADQSRCGSGSITLNATSVDTIRWYDSPNGNLLTSGSSFTTPVLNSTTVYFVRAEAICLGNFIPVNAVINPVPTSPVASNHARCGAGSVTLSASGTDTLRWYDAPHGNLLWEGNIFNTPVLNMSTTYFVRNESGCSSDFISVDAIINSLPADPAVIPGSTCGPGTVVLIASSPDTINWFDLPNGTLLGTGITYQTPSLSLTTVYYAAASNGCEGNFIPVNANVFSLPTLSLGNDTIIESGSIVTLDAGSGFVAYLWNTGETSQTTLANSTGNYWVTVTDMNGCSVTDTIQVLVTVNVQPYVIADGVLIYPNPAQSKLSISFLNGANEDIFLRLIDNNGKLIWSDFSINEKRVMRTIDLEQYAKGIYMLQIATSKTKSEHKIILK